MAPVGERGYDEAVNVRDDRLHRLAGFGRRGRELRDERARLDLGEDGELFDALEVIGDPIDDGTAVASELLGAHVAEWGREPVRGRHAWSPNCRRTRRHAQRLFVKFVLGHHRASIMAAGGPRRTAGRQKNVSRVAEKRGGQKRSLVETRGAIETWFLTESRPRH